MEPGTGTGKGMVVRVLGNSFPFPLQLYYRYPDDHCTSSTKLYMQTVFFTRVSKTYRPSLVFKSHVNHRAT